jgi:hypothetical protein
LIQCKKKDYPKLGLECSYSWAHSLMQVASALHLLKYRDKLPKGPTQLLECAKMTPDRLAEGVVEPKPGTLSVVHPLARREDLKAFANMGKPGKSAAVPRVVSAVLIVYLPLTDEDAGDPMGAVREYAKRYQELSAESGARLGLGFATSRREEPGGVRLGVDVFEEIDEDGRVMRTRTRKSSPARRTNPAATIHIAARKSSVIPPLAAPAIARP